MGASGKWIKALIGLKKPEKDYLVISITSFSYSILLYWLLLILGFLLIFLRFCFVGFGQEKMGNKGKKWKLWRSSSGEHGSSWRSLKGGRRAASEGSDCSSVAEAFSAAVAAVVRAPPKDFRVVRQEWASIRIQTAFRAFLVTGSSFFSPPIFHFLLIYCSKHGVWSVWILQVPDFGWNCRLEGLYGRWKEWWGFRHWSVAGKWGSRLLWL